MSRNESPFNERRNFLTKFQTTKFLITIVLLLGIFSFFAFILPFFAKDPDDNYAYNFIRLKFTERSESTCKPKWKWGVQKEREAEQERIFASVKAEYLDVARKLSDANKELEAVTKEIPNKKDELRLLELQIEELRLLQKELQDRRNVRLSLPNKPLLPQTVLVKNTDNHVANPDFTALEDSIDFSRCSVSSLFRVFIYVPTNLQKLSPPFQSLYKELSSSRYVTTDPSTACIFVSIVSRDDEENVENLPYWGDYGRNHLLVFEKRNDLHVSKYKASMVAAENFVQKTYRPNMDLSMFLRVPEYEIEEYQRLTPLLPHARKYLVSYISSQNGITEIEYKNFEQLKASMISSQDQAYFENNCSHTDNVQEKMSLCYDEPIRIANNRDAAFVLVFANSPSFQQRFYETLISGAVPVIIGTVEPLPFDDLIDWRLASIRITYARLPEVHFILRSVSMLDLLEMRRKGRFFLENYLLNTKALTRSILATLRYRLQMPGMPDRDEMAKPAFGESFVPTQLVPVTKPPFDDEYLGPVEAPFESPSYTHNFTSLGLYSYDIWNNLPHHVEAAPSFLPNDVSMPSESEFFDDTNMGMRPIAPGSGQEFSVSLGGNRPREQFTIVMLTYNRDNVLAASLERLNRLPYLNRVIVVWNNLDRQPSGHWPRLHVPVYFINATKNSLNNRFLPFDQIQTEAVLSMDDDIDLKQHEIIFAFRVWREQRHKIVGFPARYHARYDSAMYYNSNHTCQLSMILTGAAFLHKSYFYAYTYTMPAIIREKIDEWMNCEDLAMNFLVSHLTREPPIKTTSKWTLRCPTCSEMLSQDISHFNKRHNCIRFFTQVYGYNPLLFSQFRADSVLFKTRLPPNHQKCFRYV